MLIDGSPLTSADVLRVARDGESVEIDPALLDRLAARAKYADKAASDRPIYGRSTGVGANRSVAAPDAGHQLRLIRSHATSGGPVRSGERIRAMLVVRIAQLAADGNGISPDALTGMAALIADPPPVREYAGLGTGDLSAMGTVGQAMVDRGLWQPNGDALTLLSSNAAVLGDAILAIADLDVLARAGLVVAALTTVAARGGTEAFSPAIESATPFPGAIAVCRELRRLLDGIEPSPRIQDSYGLRTLPQIHGPLLDALAGATSVVEAMINAPAENPIVSERLGVAHHGAFHAAYLGQSLDALRLALAQAVQGSLNRLSYLSEPEVTGLRPFLADEAPAASGVMVVEYVAAAALAEVRAFATPAGLQSVTISRSTEDDASFASLAVRQALASVAPTATVIGAELVAALRAIEQGGRTVPAALADAVAVARAALPGKGDADRDLTPDLEAAAAVLPQLG